MPSAGNKAKATDLSFTSAISVTASGTFTAETTVDSITAPLIDGGVYEVRYVGTFSSSVAADKVSGRLYDTNTAGTKLYDTTQVVVATNSQITLLLEAEFTATATGNRTFIVTGTRFSGTGNITRQAAATLPARLSVRRIS